MKYTLSILSIVIVVGGIWYVTSKPAQAPSIVQSPTPTVSVVQSLAPSAATPPKTQASSTPKATPTMTVTPTPTQTVMPSAKAGTFTTAQVATHNSQVSCYSIIDGSVYDLTAYIPKHPGGTRQILDICGKDGSSLFADQHSGQSKPANVLAAYKIGVLSN